MEIVPRSPFGELGTLRREMDDLWNRFFGETRLPRIFAWEWLPSMDISETKDNLVVKAELYNGRIVRVANSFVFKEPAFNYSADFPFLWDEIVLPVRYGSNPVMTRQILKDVGDDLVGNYAAQSRTAWKQVASRYMIEEAAVEPTVTMTANENWMEFTLRYIVDYKKRRISSCSQPKRLG